MKKLLMTMTLLLAVWMLQAQMVAVVNYMKVAMGNGDAFVKSEQEWKKLHQARVNEGKMIAWELYAIHYQGTQSPYNYATVDIYPDMKAAYAGISSEEFQKAFGDKANQVMTQTAKVRDLVRSDIFMYATGIQAKAPEKFLTVTYFKVDDNERYLDMENKAYKPMHQAAIDAGKMTGWSIWRRGFPEDLRYDVVAVNGYASLDQFAAGPDYSSLMDKVKSSSNAGDLYDMFKLMEDTEKIRHIVKSQVWEAIDQTSPKQ